MSERDEFELGVVAACAVEAARALSAMLDCPAPTSEPTARALASGEQESLLAAGGEWSASIFADLSGARAGEVAVGLARETLAEAVEQLLGESPKRVPVERVCAALYELGNIVISAAAGAVARIEGGTVLPSIPRVVYEPAGSRDAPLDSLPDRREAWLAECELPQALRPLRLCLIWIPQSR